MVPDVNLLVAAMHRLTWLKGQEPGTSFSDSAYSSHDPSISDLAAALEDGSCQLAETTLDGVRRILLRAGYPVAVVMSYADWLRRTTDAHGGYHADLTWRSMHADAAGRLEDWQQHCPSLAVAPGWRPGGPGGGHVRGEKADFEDAQQAAVLAAIAERVHEREGGTVVYTTRDRYCAAAMAHTAAWLSDDGLPAEVRLHRINDDGLYETGVVRPQGAVSSYTPDYAGAGPDRVSSGAPAAVTIRRAWARTSHPPGRSPQR